MGCHQSAKVGEEQKGICYVNFQLGNVLGEGKQRSIRKHYFIYKTNYMAKNLTYLITKSLALFFKFLLSCQLFLME